MSGRRHLRKRRAKERTVLRGILILVQAELDLVALKVVLERLMLLMQRQWRVIILESIV